MDVILAIDAGTTGVRSLLIDKGGKVVDSSYEEFTQYFPSIGWVEHDPTEIWESVQSTISDVLKRNNSNPVAIGITNQRETVVAWDKNTSKPLYKALVWQDRRTSDRCVELSDSGLLPLVRESTGLVLDPYFSATKIEWLINEGGISTEDHVAFGTIDSWILWNLTNGSVFATDPTNASRTMLFNIHEMQWDSELLKIFGIEEHNLAEVLPSSGYFGSTSETAACGAGIPITGIAGDQQASLFGQAAFSIGDAKNTYGTGSFILMNVGNDCPKPVDGILSTIAWTIDSNGSTSTTYALEGSIFATGAAVQWLRDGLGIINEASELESLALECETTGDVYFVPAFTGLGSPWWDPYARGTLIGLTRGTAQPEIARAAIESMVFQTRDVIDTMRSGSGRELKSLRVDGGASVMNLLLELQADQLQVPVSRPLVHEMTALGVAHLAGLSHGFWDSLDEVSNLWELDYKAGPSETTSEAINSYQKWGKAVQRSRNWARTEE
ncbi:MAG: glycerol kinase [Acidimicrobiaceae bacterium]|nr:glycerol kinase [Acidimicrobiaceae bacterium]